MKPCFVVMHIAHDVWQNPKTGSNQLREKLRPAESELSSTVGGSGAVGRTREGRGGLFPSPYPLCMCLLPCPKVRTSQMNIAFQFTAAEKER